MALNFSKDATMSLEITDYRDLLTTIRKVEPSLIKQMRADIREVASPIRDDIKNAITPAAPLMQPPKGKGGGMSTKVGRLSWTKTKNTTRPLKSVTIESFRRINTKYTYYSIGKLRVWNAAVVLADMAGRSNTNINSKAITNKYDYTYHTKNGEIIGKRDHKINGQGLGLIKGLSKKGNASRFVWPAAEASLPHAKLEVRKSLERAYVKLNFEMLRRGK